MDLCGRTWQADGLLLRSHSASRRFYFVAPDTDCVLWVRAPAPGDRIRLQFRFFLVYSLAPPSVPALSQSAVDPPARPAFGIQRVPEASVGPRLPRGLGAGDLREPGERTA